MSPGKLILLLVVFCLIASISFQCKKVSKEIDDNFTGQTAPLNFELLQGWFYKTRSNPINYQISARGEYGDTIPWDFVADRLRKIDPQWTLGRGFQYNGFTLYEVHVEKQFGRHAHLGLK